MKVPKIIKIIGMLAILVLCLALAACIGSSVYKPPPKVVSITKIVKDARLPAMPDEKANKATLAGIDTTGVGVRDDVHIWIFKNYTTKVKRTVLLTMAQATQDVMVHPPKSKEEARALQQTEKDSSLMLKLIRGISRSESTEMAMQLYNQIVNTPQRMKAYLEYRLLLGKDPSQPSDIVPPKIPENPEEQDTDTEDAKTPAGLEKKKEDSTTPVEKIEENPIAVPPE